VVRDMWNEVLLLRVDVKRFMLPPLGPLKDRGGEAEYLNAIPEEPLRLIEYVAANDRSFGEIVTADYAIAGELAIAAWGATPMAPDPGAKLPTGWQKVAWGLGPADGRHPLERRAVDAAPVERHQQPPRPGRAHLRGLAVQPDFWAATSRCSTTLTCPTRTRSRPP
jgi:hypothetical protein